MFAKTEPGTTASIAVGGVSLVALLGPMYDLLVELGARPRLATAIIGIAMGLSSVVAALWARSRTVTTETQAATAAVALSLPSNANEDTLNIALAKEQLPTVDLSNTKEALEKP